MNYDSLFHDKSQFERQVLEQRMRKFGFKNLSRMELFLWDLELYLQIQSILGERIVLKGGAAAQFYLPTALQRTSVDIDMIFFGTKEEIDDTLGEIGKKLGADGRFFVFHEHNPKNPKTGLPLYTYYVMIPSVLTGRELNSDSTVAPGQEVKVEFIMESSCGEAAIKTGEDIFAVRSGFSYRILPISLLFADKLTTIGSATIGVQDDRMDEQVKQFYDVMMLLRNCSDELVFDEVRTAYFERARAEWEDRYEKPFNAAAVEADVRRQLLRYSMADSGEDSKLKKHIADFYGLYLNSNVEFTPQSVACGAGLVGLLYELIVTGEGWEKVNLALKVERNLGLNHLKGREKGDAMKKIRNLLVENFHAYSQMPENVLKGKNPRRIFWSVVNAGNIEYIAGLVDSFLNNL